MRALLARAVTSAGHEVIAHAEDLDAALAAATALAPDVVVLDARLPGAPMARAVERLRASAPAASVLVLVALTERELLGAALAAGAHGGLVRPVRPPDVREAFARIASGLP